MKEHLTAGRTLDALIHKHVMGNTVDDGRSWSVPHYSTEIAEAWRVVEHLMEMEQDVNGPFQMWDIALQTETSISGYVWRCTLHGWGEHLGEPTAVADTVELAICLAALHAVGVEV